MKKHELKTEIKKYITEILLENEDEMEDTWNKPDEDSKSSEDREPSKAELKKEKVKTPSKFKIPNDQFTDFKTKLKNIVTKIKDMKNVVKFNLLGMTFELPSNCLRTHSYSIED